MKIRRWIALLTSMTLSLATVAHAETCRSGQASLSERDVEARVAFLHAAFASEVQDIDIWSWTWGSVYAAGTIAQASAAALVHNPDTRTDLTVGTISAAIGTVSLTVLPLKITLPLRREVTWNLPDRCQVLAQAESVLLAQVRNEAIANGILAHLGNLAANVALLLVLGVGYGHWQSASISAGIGLVVGEANAITQPHHLASVLARYRAGELQPVAKLKWQLVPILTPQLYGVAVSASW